MLKNLFKKDNENKEEKNMKWSLKKKIGVGIGLAGAAVLGAIALGLGKQEEVVQNEENLEYGDCYDEDDGEFVDNDNEDQDRNAELGE